VPNKTKMLEKTRSGPAAAGGGEGKVVRGKWIALEKVQQKRNNMIAPEAWKVEGKRTRVDNSEGAMAESD